MGFTMIKEDLPRTRLGKIRRFELQKRYTELVESREPKKKKYSQTDLDILERADSRKVLDFLKGRLGKDITLDDHLEIDFGIDSLTRIELADGLERILNVKIPNELIMNVFTVRELLQEIDILEKGDITERFKTDIFDWKDLLNRIPPEDILRKVRLHPSLLDKILTFIFTRPLYYVFRILWQLKVEGIDRLPAKGPYILCPNHASFLDGFIVAESLPYRIELDTFFLGHAGYFEHPLVAWGIRVGRLVSLDPNIHLVEAMQISSYILRNGKVMCIFPEGRRSVDENIQDFKKGVGILSKELDVPLVPVLIEGSHFAWPRTRRFPRPFPLKIIYGSPISASELLARSNKKDLDEHERIVAALRDEVLKLRRN
jgi:long-chain acyl-CoA synthetase